MQRIRFLRSNVLRVSILTHIHLDSPCNLSTHVANPTITTNLASPLNYWFSIIFSSFSTSKPEIPTSQQIPESLDSSSCNDNNNDDDDDNDNDNEADGERNEISDDEQLNFFGNEVLVQDVKTIIDILCKLGKNRVEMKNNLEQCGVKVTSELVLGVLSRVRNDWEAAFTFFLWAGKQPGYGHSVREYHSMISILAKMRKFDTAWALIDEMRGGRIGPSLVTPQTLLIMIRRYCAVHDVGRAINTYYAYKRFKFDVGIEEFQSLLSALCRYKNVQDAEHLMFCNKNVFALDTKSFNIVLNGWGNVIGSPREAERVWREMGKRGIQYDVVSYSSIMSCYSKAGNLHMVLRLYNQMKKLGIEPDRKVYNAVIHALAKGRHVKEALNLMKAMEGKGIAPNIVTYNSLIKPLCKSLKVDEAREVFDEMLQRGLSPTTHTYHAFLRILRTGEEVFSLLEKMRRMGCQPTIDTYIMLIRKFCRWRQLDNVYKLWNEINENGIGPDRSAYIVLIHGLFLNGKLEEAHKLYVEMKEKQLLPEPKIDGMLQAWLSNKQIAEYQLTEIENKQLDCSRTGKKTRVTSNKFEQERDFRQLPESRRVVREQGFSFWGE